MIQTMNWSWPRDNLVVADDRVPFKITKEHIPYIRRKQVDSEGEYEEGESAGVV